MRLANQNTLRKVIAYFRFKGWFQGLSDLETYRLILNYQRDKELSLGLHYEGEALKASRPYVIQLVKLAYLADSSYMVEDFQELKEQLLKFANTPEQEQRELEIFEASTRLLGKNSRTNTQANAVDLNLLGSVQNPETGERTRFTPASELIHLNSVLGFPYYISALFANAEGEPFKNAQSTIDSSCLACHSNTPKQLVLPTNGEGSSNQLFISLAPYMKVSPDGIILSRENVLAFENGDEISNNAVQLANAPTLRINQKRKEIFDSWIQNKDIELVKRHTMESVWEKLQTMNREIFYPVSKDAMKDFYKYCGFTFNRGKRPKNLPPI